MLLTSGCGYASSGTWTDAPKNWQRAFRSTKPPDVVVVHSHYWRSSHWSLEFEYFFHIRANEALRQQLLTANEMVQLKHEESSEPVFFGKKPAWFLPKHLDSYEVWKYRIERNSSFRVFVDKENGDLFLTDNVI